MKNTKLSAMINKVQEMETRTLNYLDLNDASNILRNCHSSLKYAGRRRSIVSKSRVSTRFENTSWVSDRTMYRMRNTLRGVYSSSVDVKRNRFTRDLEITIN